MNCAVMNYFMQHNLREPGRTASFSNFCMSLLIENILIKID